MSGAAAHTWPGAASRSDYYRVGNQQAGGADGGAVTVGEVWYGLTAAAAGWMD